MSENIASLLDASIDDLADLPEFAVYPAGVHTVNIDWEQKEVNKHPSVELKMTLVETVELANPGDDKPLTAGAEASVLFMLDNEFGQGNLKDVMKVLAGICGTSKISETMEAAKGLEVTVVVKTKPDKKDPDVMRMNIKKMLVE